MNYIKANQKLVSLDYGVLGKGTYYVRIDIPETSPSYGKNYVVKTSITNGFKGALNYNATVHIQSIGDKNYKNVNGTTQLGTSGRSLRLESFKMNILKKPYSGSLQYRVHVEAIGWQGWKKEGSVAGTSGRALRLEALSIKLTGTMASKYDVYYRTHIQGIGWTGWAKNGQDCGSAGYAYRMESMQIVLVEKGGIAPGSNSKYFYQK